MSEKLFWNSARYETGLESWLQNNLKSFLAGTQQQAVRMRSAPPKDPFAGDLDWNGERICWRKLANAVIIQAALDWREARRKMRQKRAQEEALETIRETEEFFLSDWCSVLTRTSGRTLLRKLKEEAERDDKRIPFPDRAG